MANELGHEVDLDRNEYKYLASEDSVSSAAKSDKSSGAAAGVAAGAAAALVQPRLPLRAHHARDPAELPMSCVLNTSLYFP